MSRRLPFAVFFALFLCIGIILPAQTHEAGSYPEVLRGEVWVELEPVYGTLIDAEYPLDVPAAGRRALEEAALFYSAMIYGWSFQYEIGEKARQIPEKLDLSPVASIPFGDPGLRATEVEIRDMRVRLWTDYHLSDAQQRRLLVWQKDSVRNAQALGYASPDGSPAYAPPGGGALSGSPSEPGARPAWLAVRTAALEDAARSALRTALRASERNRPKEATGFISLAAFPRYFMSGGQWAVSARFRVDIAEIVPFAVY